MSEIKKFKFMSVASEKEIQEAAAPVRKSFSPGKYDLKIIDAALNITDRNPTGTSPSDPTWLVYKVVLGGIGDKSINHYVLVPTATERFGAPGTKNPLFMFLKFREFLSGIGEDPTKVQELLEPLFSDPIALVGKEVSVEIGYEGPHARYNENDKTFSVVDTDDTTELLSDRFPDRDSATAAAAVQLKKELKNFTKVRKFVARPKQNDGQEW